jgi:hypothetical protein
LEVNFEKPITLKNGAFAIGLGDRSQESGDRSQETGEGNETLSARLPDSDSCRNEKTHPNFSGQVFPKIPSGNEKEL